MFDLWFSLSNNLASIYAKRKEGLLNDAVLRCTSKAQQSVIRSTWTEYSTSPLRGGDGGGGGMMALLRSSPSSSSPSAASASASAASTVGMGTSSPRSFSSFDHASSSMTSPRRSAGPTATTTPQRNLNLLRSSNIADATRNETIDAIVAKTQQVLADSARRAEARRSKMLMNTNSATITNGTNDGAVTAARTARENGNFVSFPVIGKVSENGTSFATRTALEREEDAVRAEDHLRFPSLVQKHGLSIEHKKRVLAESSEANRRFVASFDASVASSLSAKKEEGIVAAAGSSGSDGATKIIPSPPSTIGSAPPASSSSSSSYPYPPTLPRQRVVATVGRGGKPLTPRSRTAATANSSPPISPSSVVEHVSIDWSTIQKQVAADLAAMERRDEVRYREQRQHARQHEEAVAAMVAKERAFLRQQVTEVDHGEAKVRREEAFSAAEATMNANRAFEALMAKKESERIETLRKTVAAE